MRPVARLATGVAAVLAAATSIAALDACAAMGSRSQGARLERIEASAQWTGKKFENPEPLYNDMWQAAKDWRKSGDDKSPKEPLPVIQTDPKLFETPPPTGLRVTWLGHSTTLIEIDGQRVLTDPMFGPRASPVTWAGPKRWYPPPLPLADVPKLDAVVLSHDHYDHLDHTTIVAMKDWDTLFVVPLGVGAHLEGWGVPTERIVELDWWEEKKIGALTLTCTPARHASGRGVLDQNATLWAGWTFTGPEHRVYFSGDTGLFSQMHEIGDRLGPFDLTMIESGAYGQAWPDWHIGPEQAVLAHTWMRGEVFMPIHWGLFNLASHNWTAPVERSVTAAARASVSIAVPRPGGSFEPGALGELERWWPEVPYRNAEEDPIVSTQVEYAPGKIRPVPSAVRPQVPEGAATPTSSR